MKTNPFHQTVIVTGGATEIGYAVAAQFVERGANVLLNGRTRAKLAGAAEKLGNSDRVAFIAADITQPANAPTIVDAALERFGRLDVLVNNAGIYRFARLEEITEDEFHQHFNINVLGTILATREAVKYFGPNGGSVINMSSIASAGVPEAAVYSGSKGAVDAITRGLAEELGPRKIRVNAIAPGGVETEGTHSGGIVGSDFEKAMIARTPLGRFGQPDDIARVAVFLASEDSAWLTGERLAASGGYR